MEKFDLAQSLLTRATTEIVQKGVTCRAGEIPPPACRFCQEICPEKAIAVREHAVEINKGACIQCGLCTRCPLGFLELMEMDRILPLLFKELLKKSEEIHLRCHRILPSKRGISGFPIPCIAYLKPSHLALLVLNGARKVWLQHPDCAKCRLNASSLVENLKKSWEKLIELWKIPLKVEFGRKKPRGFKGESKGDEEELGRRDFFLQLKRNVVGKISEKIPDFIINPKPKIPHDNFLYPEFLKFGLPKKEVVGRELVPWGEVEVNKNCNLCGECVYVCPPKALQIEVRDGEKRLVFYPASCSQCRFCEGLCPQKGIKISPAVDFSLWGKRVVFSFEE
jgi:ferredoxin